MDGKDRFLVKEDNILLKTLVSLAKERLTKKQKQILEFLAKSENKNQTATSLVRILSKGLNCSRSALWNNLNSLKKAGLVNEGSPVRLTLAAEKIMEGEWTENPC